jgi:flavin reductase (DIM6/NTAB) family NADH-FMN oxidoreductase RutF
MTVPGEVLRHVMRRWTSGVCVISTISGDFRHGMTVNSFTSISTNPALVTVTLMNTTRTYHMVVSSGIFGITVLSVDQQAIADRFAGRTGDESNRFEGIDVFTLQTGVPFITGGLAHLDCRVVFTHPMPESSLFIGEVLAAQRIDDDRPLVYFNRDYHRLLQ